MLGIPHEVVVTWPWTKWWPPLWTLSERDIHIALYGHLSLWSHGQWFTQFELVCVLLTESRRFFPFIGHTGICTSDGIIYDFAGPYTIGTSNWRCYTPIKSLFLFHATHKEKIEWRLVLLLVILNLTLRTSKEWAGMYVIGAHSKLTLYDRLHMFWRKQWLEGMQIIQNECTTFGKRPMIRFAL